MSGDVLYDSNEIGKWKFSGPEKIIKTFDDRFPKPFVNGKGLEMHASGNPVLTLDGTGVGTLEADPGHGRVYIDAVNYMAVTEYELRFNDNAIDNHTCQTQSRHEELPESQKENRFGGLHHMIDRKNKKCGLKVERFHNDHLEDQPKKTLPKSIAIGQWVKVRLTDTPDQSAKTVNLKQEIDWNDGEGFIKTIEHKFTGLKDYMVNETKFKQISYTWFRINNKESNQKGSISIRNIIQTSI
jgi:hypothetical protein